MKKILKRLYCAYLVLIGKRIAVKIVNKKARPFIINEIELD